MAVRLSPIPSLPERCIIPAGVYQAYSEISRHFNEVQVGRDESWVLGADTDRGSLRVVFSRSGVMESLQAMQGGKDISGILNGDLGMALHMHDRAIGSQGHEASKFRRTVRFSVSPATRKWRRAHRN